MTLTPSGGSDHRHATVTFGDGQFSSPILFSCRTRNGIIHVTEGVAPESLAEEAGAKEGAKAGAKEGAKAGAKTGAKKEGAKTGSKASAKEEGARVGKEKGAKAGAIAQGDAKDGGIHEFGGRPKGNPQIASVLGEQQTAN